LDPDDTAASFARGLAAARTPFLWLTAGPKPAVPDGGEVLQLTTLRGGMGTADPRRLRDLRTAATTFFDERGPGVVMVDCLASLILHSGVERVLRFVEDLHEEIAIRNGFLVVFADAQRTNARMIAWLERELDSFPRHARAPGVEDRLVV